MATGEGKNLHQKIDRLEQQVRLLKKKNADLEAKARQADSASQAKSDFLAMISHEIRTPMNGVIGLTELLLETELTPRQTHFADLILSSGRNLLTLLNSLLDFSKIEADKLHLEIKPFNLKELLAEIMALHRLAGKRKGLDVRLELDSGLADRYLGDPFRLRQVLVNLLGNAIKFTQQGTVLLRVGLQESDDPETLFFTITDSGPGIPEDKHDQLFVAFSQVDNSSTRQHGGTGLGLSICKKLIELMGGTIGFSSSEGQGSSFWFTLHLARPRTSKPNPARDRSSRPAPDSSKNKVRTATARILIVDDDETNRMVLEEIFRKTGARIVIAEDGEQAVRICRQQGFDLILMDCRMPVMDGFEATRAIRAHLKQMDREDTVILALTADATPAAEEQCRRAGMDGYLVKPLDTIELQNMLDLRVPDCNLTVLSSHAAVSPEHGRKTTLEIVDLEVLAKLRMNIGDIQPVISVFLRLLPTRLKELNQAVARKDNHEIEHIAHTLRGSCSQFGADLLTELFSQLEDMARENHSSLIERQCARIQRTAREVCIILQEQLD